MTRTLTYFLSHPIQYQSPLLRRLALEDDLSFRVVYDHDFSTRTYFDQGFQSEVRWDIPLREGYRSDLLADVSVNKVLRESDAVWFHGWQSKHLRRILKDAARRRKLTLMRGENWFGAMPDGNGVRRLVRRAYHKSIFRYCSAFLTIGQKNKEYYLDHGVSQARLFDMPYAVDNHAFRQRANDTMIAEVRQSLDVAPEQKIILYAGKLQRRKNPHHLLEALKTVSHVGAISPVLVFAGDGEMRRELEVEASASPSIKFVGFKNQTEMPAYYAAADVFVLPAEREPWGLAINEAMASGTAVVASDQCGAAYDLITPETGRIIEAGNMGALASAISEILARSHEMGAAAQAHVKLWDFEADVRGILSALEVTV